MSGKSTKAKKSGRRVGKGRKKAAKSKKAAQLEVEPDEGWRDNVREKLSSLVDDEKLASAIEAALYQKIRNNTSKTEQALFQDSIFKHRYLYQLQTLVCNLDPEEYVGNENLVIRNCS